jgi:hypothetical protein
MNFLQPWMLVALPLIAMPIIIHLVNQRRFQTVPWAAMMFLLQASKMSSGYTKLRQWLILIMRTLAVASLIFFTARPLASGLMGLIGNRTDEVAIVLLDRSPSMQQTQPGTGLTKQQSAILQLSNTLQTLGVKRVALFDSASEKPIELESPSEMDGNPALMPNGITSDLPGLMERALSYVKSNKLGSTDIWICSDMRESDWRSRDGRWSAAREGFVSLSQDVRFHVLDLNSVSTENLSIHVMSANRIAGVQGPELSLSFKLERTNQSSDASESTAPMNTTGTQIPVEVEVANVRTIVNVDLQAETSEVNDYRIPLSHEKSINEKSSNGTSSNGTSAQERANQELDGATGWGLVRIPADTNNADNVSYFAFEKPPVRRTIVVSDNPNVIEAIELCTNISPSQSIQCETETATSSQLDSVDWNTVSLVIWHEQLPQDRPLELLEDFVSSGGRILFFPPEAPNPSKAFGLKWTQWETVQPVNASSASTATNVDASSSANETPAGIAQRESETSRLARIQQWQNDSELLSNTLNGAALPVGQIGILRICRLEGSGTPLATLQDNLPILLRMDFPPTVSASVPVAESGTGTTYVSSKATEFSNSGIYACTTTPSTRDSTLAIDGIVMYVAIQRALAAGSERVGKTKMMTVGQGKTEQFEQAVQQSGDQSTYSSFYLEQPGVYKTKSMLIAQNRSLEEDSPKIVQNASLVEMFGSLNWSRIDAGANANSLVQEIWKWFVILMLFALILEAILCIPKRRMAQSAAVR